METMHRRLFRATLILLATASGPGPMGAQVPEPRPLVMTAENLMAHDARHRERPGAAGRDRRWTGRASGSERREGKSYEGQNVGQADV